MMHSVWIHSLACRKTLRNVKWSWLYSVSCRSPRKDIQKFLQVSAVSVVMVLGITPPGTAGRSRAVFWHADNMTHLVDIWTSHLYVARQQWGTSFNYSWLELSQQVWEHTLLLSPVLLCVFAQISCLLQINPVMFIGSVRFEVCLVSKCYLLFQFLALVLAWVLTLGFWIAVTREPNAPHTVQSHQITCWRDDNMGYNIEQDYSTANGSLRLFFGKELLWAKF